MPEVDRQRAADAHRLANDLAGDLLAGVKCYDLLVTDLEINQRLTTSESTGAMSAIANTAPTRLSN